MVRILLLKRLYNLSDEQMEYQLLDRLSYKRFCGLVDALNIPDPHERVDIREPHWRRWRAGVVGCGLGPAA